MRSNYGYTETNLPKGAQEELDDLRKQVIQLREAQAGQKLTYVTRLDSDYFVIPGPQEGQPSVRLWNAHADRPTTDRRAGTWPVAHDAASERGAERMSVAPDDYSKLLVCSKRCDQCLFSRNRIVSADRARQVIDEARANDAAFLCHKHTIRGALGLASGAQANVVCRGYFDAVGSDVLLIRLAKMFGNIIYVNEDGKEQAE